MPEIPQEAPLIIKWKDHLPKMKNCSYMVDGIEIRFVDYMIYTDNETIVLTTSARFHTVPFAHMPEFLRHWIPVEVEDMPYYNHLFAEAGIEIPANNKLQAPISDEERMKSKYLDAMDALVADMESIRENLKNATINIKDPKSGVAGQGFINQANQIANLNDKRIKNNVTLLQAFSLLQKMLDKDKKDSKKNKKDE